MVSTVSEEIERLREFIDRTGAKQIDLKIVDLPGRWHHLTLPAERLSEDLFTLGVGIDGSSLPGFKSIQAGDLVVTPDLETLFLDPFWELPTASVACHILEADSRDPFDRDPRRVAQKAEEYLRSLGIAETSLWGPELEFYVFDEVRYRMESHSGYFFVDSAEASWGSVSENGSELGYRLREQGYHAIPPSDELHNLRAEMVERIEASGTRVRYHHHEVGEAGQCEIEIMHEPLLKAADAVMTMKYIIKNTARQHGQSATFMPKPLYQKAGTGLHMHQHLAKANAAPFYDADGYAGLSVTALHYIGGLLTHARALAAFTNPSTNSYKRLVPGYEAPVKLFFSIGNRSAAIRIPKYATTPEEKRLEYRPPDATCNVYLAMAAQLMAGIDGIQRRIDPRGAFGPFDVDVFHLPEKEKAKIDSLPTSLEEALEALEQDYQFLLKDEVFTQDLIETWIKLKRESEVEPLQAMPHPFEFELYYDA